MRNNTFQHPPEGKYAVTTLPSPRAFLVEFDFVGEAPQVCLLTIRGFVIPLLDLIGLDFMISFFSIVLTTGRGLLRA